MADTLEMFGPPLVMAGIGYAFYSGCLGETLTTGLLWGCLGLVALGLLSAGGGDNDFQGGRDVDGGGGG